MSSTTLVVPDAHCGPNQNYSRFDKLGQLIVHRKPDRIIFMGDFSTLESLSAWDLNKSGVMEGRRYAEDISAGNYALDLTLSPLRCLQDKQRANKDKQYRPRIVYIKGNHEDRLDRYMQTKPELKEHLDLERDLCLMEHGITDVVPYKDYIEFEGVQFTHVPLNGASQPLSGRYAIHRAAEGTAKSLVFAHTHRRENVNFYRHGSSDIIQVLTCGAFFEHTDSYAYGGLNSYWRGLCLLSHYAPGRFDVEDISLERLRRLYE